MYEAKILRHSVSEAGVELISFEVNYPHAIHKDIMTHRWARNFRSFRATPPEKLFEEIAANPFIPEKFNSRVKGMGEGVESPQAELARVLWLRHVDNCLATARNLNELGLAKAQVNFVIQDLCWIRGIITTTMPQLENFFGLRLELDDEGRPKARPEVYRIALDMLTALEGSRATILKAGDWHLPLVDAKDYADLADIAEMEGPRSATDIFKKLSVARCARVSYLTHEGMRDPEKDIALYNSLLRDGHMSPFEHQGTPIKHQTPFDLSGSFGFGWIQYRKTIPGESNYTRRKEL